MAQMKDDVCNVNRPSPQKLTTIKLKKKKKNNITGGFKMKKLSYALVGILLLTFIFSFTMTPPLIAQEEEKEAEELTRSSASPFCRRASPR